MSIPSTPPPGRGAKGPSFTRATSTVSKTKKVSQTLGQRALTVPVRGERGTPRPPSFEGKNEVNLFTTDGMPVMAHFLSQRTFQLMDDVQKAKELVQLENELDARLHQPGLSGEEMAEINIQITKIGVEKNALRRKYHIVNSNLILGLLNKVNEFLEKESEFCAKILRYSGNEQGKEFANEYLSAINDPENNFNPLVKQADRFLEKFHKGQLQSKEEKKIAKTLFTLGFSPETVLLSKEHRFDAIQIVLQAMVVERAMHTPWKRSIEELSQKRLEGLVATMEEVKETFTEQFTQETLQKFSQVVLSQALHKKMKALVYKKIQDQVKNFQEAGQKKGVELSLNVDFGIAGVAKMEISLFSKKAITAELDSSVHVRVGGGLAVKAKAGKKQLAGAEAQLAGQVLSGTVYDSLERFVDAVALDITASIMTRGLFEARQVVKDRKAILQMIHEDKYAQASTSSLEHNLRLMIPEIGDTPFVSSRGRILPPPATYRELGVDAVAGAKLGSIGLEGEVKKTRRTVVSHQPLLTSLEKNRLYLDCCEDPIWTTVVTGQEVEGTPALSEQPSLSLKKLEKITEDFRLEVDVYCQAYRKAEEASELIDDLKRRVESVKRTIAALKANSPEIYAQPIKEYQDLEETFLRQIQILKRIHKQKLATLKRMQQARGLIPTKQLDHGEYFAHLSRVEKRIKQLYDNWFPDNKRAFEEKMGEAAHLSTRHLTSPTRAAEPKQYQRVLLRKIEEGHAKLQVYCSVVTDYEKAKMNLERATGKSSNELSDLELRVKELKITKNSMEKDYDVKGRGAFIKKHIIEYSKFCQLYDEESTEEEYAIFEDIVKPKYDPLYLDPPILLTAKQQKMLFADELFTDTASSQSFTLSFPIPGINFKEATLQITRKVHYEDDVPEGMRHELTCTVSLPASWDPLLTADMNVIAVLITDYIKERKAELNKTNHLKKDVMVFFRSLCSELYQLHKIKKKVVGKPEEFLGDARHDRVVELRFSFFEMEDVESYEKRWEPASFMVTKSSFAKAKVPVGKAGAATVLAGIALEEVNVLLNLYIPSLASFEIFAKKLQRWHQDPSLQGPAINKKWRDRLLSPDNSSFCKMVDAMTEKGEPLAEEIERRLQDYEAKDPDFVASFRQNLKKVSKLGAEKFSKNEKFVLHMVDSLRILVEQG